MYKVCSTLLTSLEEVFKAVRRKICNTISSALMCALNGIIKKTAKYYTKEELEDLKKQGEELNAAMAVTFVFHLTPLENRKRIESSWHSQRLVKIL